MPSAVGTGENLFDPIEAGAEGAGHGGGHPGSDLEVDHQNAEEDQHDDD